MDDDKMLYIDMKSLRVGNDVITETFGLVQAWSYLVNISRHDVPRIATIQMEGTGVL